jgi:hypothetical protein
MMTLDLAERTHGGKIRNLSGKEAGELARVHFKLDELDNVEGPITVLVPKEVYNVSPSFFCGMFGESYEKLGEVKLLSHYQFKSVPDFISKQLHFGVKLCSETYS